MTEIAAAGSLVAIALAVSFYRGLRLEKELLVASGRALLQLFVVATVIHVVLGEVGLSGLVLLIMLAAASWTSGRRLQGVPRAPWLALGAISVAAGVGLLVLFGAGVFPFRPRYLIPIAGMLIGNSMTATAVAGMRLRDDLVDKSLEVEARLALGAPAREALKSYVSRATTIALVPTIDATKNVGLILLPGAFVGMLLGGASPARAAQVQLIVLFMLLGAISLAAMVMTVLVSRAFVASGERLVLPPAARGTSSG